MSNLRVGILLVIVLILGSIYYSNRANTDLLAVRGWQNFAGASTTPEGLLIQPLERSISHQDGSLGQPNPPVALLGPHLSISGDFLLTARVEDIDARGTLRLYSAPPIVYDQWRFETASIALDIATSSIVVRIWDGSASSALDMRTYPYMLKKMAVISLEHRGDVFIVSADRHELGSLPDHHLFDSKQLWFGADAAMGDDWVLSALTVQPLRGGRVEIVPVPSFALPHEDSDALRNLSALNPRKLRIGGAVALGAFVTDEKYRNIALGQFDMLTPENGMKPQFIHPQESVYTFTEMDALVDIAQKNDMLVHGHALLYAKSNPAWMNSAPKEKLENIMVEHITTVVGHFRGKVAEWDVVNEPLSNKKAPYHDARSGLDDNLWYGALGERYIDVAFRAAHSADPSAQLYLNEYGLERNGERWDALLGLIRRLKARGVPIDGIGFESHVYGDSDYIDPTTLRAHMRTLSSLGLKVRISEIDVTGDDLKEQTHQYVLALDACLRAPNCTGYSLWGVTDAYGSTTRSDRYPLVYGTSLLWDKDMKAKPAFAALEERLRQTY